VSLPIFITKGSLLKGEYPLVLKDFADRYAIIQKAYEERMRYMQESDIKGAYKILRFPRYRTALKVLRCIHLLDDVITEKDIINDCKELRKSTVYYSINTLLKSGLLDKHGKSKRENYLKLSSFGRAVMECDSVSNGGTAREPLVVICPEVKHEPISPEITCPRCGSHNTEQRKKGEGHCLDCHIAKRPRYWKYGRDYVADTSYGSEEDSKGLTMISGEEQRKEELVRAK
jgi:hypothetical protein